MQLSSLIRKASYWSEQRLIQRTTANQSGEDKWSWNHQLQMGSPFPKAQGKSWRRGPKSGKTVELVSLGTALWTLSNCACLYKINIVNILAWMEERLKPHPYLRLLETDCCWGKKCPFSPEMWPLWAPSVDGPIHVHRCAGCTGFSELERKK